MPEGDTVYWAARRLRDALAGATLRRTDFRVPRFATADLAGRAVEDVVPRGKHLFIRVAGELTLHTHFKMDGAWHLYRHGERWRGPGWQARAVLATDDWVAVGFRLPVVELLPRGSETEIADRLGPDPLGPDWDATEALRRLTRDPARTISAALLDQGVMAGPGNVYRCELCFLRGLDPWTPVGTVRDPGALVALVKRLFEANRDGHRRVTTGDARRGHELWVYSRRGLPCRRCGTPIRYNDASPDASRTGDAERVTYWCPSCQPAAARATER